MKVEFLLKNAVSLSREILLDQRHPLNSGKDLIRKNEQNNFNALHLDLA